MKSIVGSSPLEVWQVGSEHLINHGGSDYNVLLAFPCASALNEAPLETHDPSVSLGGNFDSARDVANTIFPKKTWANSGSRQTLYSRYLRAHRMGRKKQWGTYFGRMIRFGQTEVNQLERLIEALNTWQTLHRAALVVHLSSSETDKLRHLGGPCLQYLQFNCPTRGTVDLVAIYRNHDYSNKVLGNLYGLARLLRFVCDQTDCTAGTVVVHSIHAYLSASMAKQKILIGA